jgi:pimeloyl-ACP methyl ester carboxylesterase
MQFREHGPRNGSPVVVVLHGGPGAVGSAGGLARLLADPARVLEPWQEALTVETHISDVLSFVSTHCDEPPVIVGHSWGAMLALAFAAEHPSRVAALCLVCSGTFDLEARAEFQRALEQQMPTHAEGLSRADRDAIVDRIYTVAPLPADPLDRNEFDERANEASWNDMLRLQADGTYPAAFARVQVPVLMVHGADDPHPGRMIRASLAPYLPQLEYHELARCSHYPWREREARDELARLVRAWLYDR